jgi:hypothetical protein
MIKNWTVKTKQITKGEDGLISYNNYLLSNTVSAHHDTVITDLNNSHFAPSAIINEVNTRRADRKKKALRGGGVRNYGTSFVLSLPDDVYQPTPKEWKKIAANAVKDIAKTNNLDPRELWKKTSVILHQEPHKKNHLNLILPNVNNLQVTKGITQLKTTFAVKNSFNDSMLKLGVDNREYMPKNKNVGDKPLYIARLENLQKEQDKNKAILAHISDFMTRMSNYVKSVTKRQHEAKNAQELAETVIETPTREIAKQLHAEVVDYEKENDVDFYQKAVKKETKSRKRRRRKNP